MILFFLALCFFAATREKPSTFWGVVMLVSLSIASLGGIFSLLAWIF